MSPSLSVVGRLEERSYRRQSESSGVQKMPEMQCGARFASRCLRMHQGRNRRSADKNSSFDSGSSETNIWPGVDQRHALHSRQMGLHWFCLQPVTISVPDWRIQHRRKHLRVAVNSALNNLRMRYRHRSRRALRYAGNHHLEARCRTHQIRYRTTGRHLTRKQAHLRFFRRRGRSTTSRAESPSTSRTMGGLSRCAFVRSHRQRWRSRLKMR